MSSWRWRLHPGWGGYPTSPRRLTNHKLRWSTVVIASTQLTWQCHLSYRKFGGWSNTETEYMGVLESQVPWYRGKTAKITTQQSICVDDLSVPITSDFRSIHQILDKFRSGLRDSVKKTNRWNMTISQVHSIMFHQPPNSGNISTKMQ